jgi:hypothetical protein
MSEKRTKNGVSVQYLCVHEKDGIVFKCYKEMTTYGNFSKCSDSDFALSVNMKNNFDLKMQANMFMYSENGNCTKESDRWRIETSSRLMYCANLHITIPSPCHRICFIISKRRDVARNVSVIRNVSVVCKDVACNVSVIRNVSGVCKDVACNVSLARNVSTASYIDSNRQCVHFSCRKPECNRMDKPFVISVSCCTSCFTFNP